MKKQANIRWTRVTASLATIAFSVMLFGHTYAQSEDANGALRHEIIIKDVWKGFNWSNNDRQTRTYDSLDRCISIISERWNGAQWKKQWLERFLYDNLHYRTANLIYRWEADSWKLRSGTRAKIDTTDDNGNRVILYEARWNADQNMWMAGDSVFYDKDNHVLKMVNRSYEVSESGADSTLIIHTIHNTRQGKSNWIEDSKTWRSDTRQVSEERCRYRSLSDSTTRVYTIDYWDKPTKSWVLNTAKLFRREAGTALAYDSIVEVINKQPVAVYVEAESKDKHGNTLEHRTWQKSFDEKGKLESGYYYKWERKPTHKDYFTIAESTFTVDTTQSRWKLFYYENRGYDATSRGNTTEWGYYTDAHEWEQIRSYDTLTSCGLTISGEQYFDTEENRWLPLVHFIEEKEPDSTVITTEVLNLETGDWMNDSLFVVRLNEKGKLKNHINYVWKRTSALGGSWAKDSRVVYFRPEE